MLAVVQRWVMGRSPATVDLPVPVDVWFVDNDRHACLMFVNVSAPCHCCSAVLSPVAVSVAGVIVWAMCSCIGTGEVCQQ